MTQSWKDWRSLAWFVAVAVIVAAAQVLVEFDGTKIADWSTWAIGAGSGILRAIGAALLAYFAKAKAA